MAKHKVERLEVVGAHPDGGCMTLGHVVFPEGSLLLTPAAANEFLQSARTAVIPYLFDCFEIIAKGRWVPVAGPGSTYTDAVRRGAIMSRNCPTCGAKAGNPCVRHNGNKRISVHRARLP